MHRKNGIGSTTQSPKRRTRLKALRGHKPAQGRDMSRQRRPVSQTHLEDNDGTGGDEANSSNTKKKFSASEDSYLQYLVSIHGPNDWKKIAWSMNGRTVRQCRERWKYYLEPNINRKGWTKEEDDILLEKYAELGPKWAQLTSFFQNRTDIDLKNRFHKIQRSRRRSERRMTMMPETQKDVPESILPVLNPGRIVSWDLGRESQGLTNVTRDGPGRQKNIAGKSVDLDPLEQISIHNLLNK